MTPNDEARVEREARAIDPDAWRVVEGSPNGTIDITSALVAQLASIKVARAALEALPVSGAVASGGVEAALDAATPAFRVGDRVEKFSGEARYSGEIVCVYTTKKGGVRYVVEVEPQGFQMICTAGMLRAAIRAAGEDAGHE